MLKNVNRIPVRAIVMDFGNTLVDYPLSDWQSQIVFIDRFLARYLKTLPLDRRYSLRELSIRLNTENSDGSVWPFVDRLRSSSFFGTALTVKAAQDFETAICQAVFKRAVVFQESLEFVSILRVSGYRTGIVSNLPWGTSPIIWNQEFRRHGFTPNLIDQAVCCVDVGFRKPNPAALKECISRLNCDPHEVLFVGDSASDTQAALAAGCVPVLLDRENSHSSYSGIRVTKLFDIMYLLPNLTQLSTLRALPSEAFKNNLHHNVIPT
jgi:FMN phosphatase YigB (HAD superfamily)